MAEYRSLPRAVFAREEDEAPADYRRMQTDFAAYRTALIRDRDARHRARNIDALPHIDFVELQFFEPYDYEKFANRYRNNFGLVPVKFEKFNTKVLLAIIDDALFGEFLAQLQSFIDTRDHTGKRIMTRVSDNMLTTGFRGKIGQFIVFRVINGKTFASRSKFKIQDLKFKIRDSRFKDSK